MSLFVWTTEISTVVYVANEINIILLGDSMKSYKLATFSCKLHQQNSWALLLPELEYSTQTKILYHAVQFYQCLGLWSIHYPVRIISTSNRSWPYQCTFQCHGLPHLLLPIYRAQRHPFANHHSDLLQSAISDWRYLQPNSGSLTFPTSNRVVTDMFKMDSATMWLIVNNLWIVAPVKIPLLLRRVSVPDFRASHHGSPPHTNTYKWAVYTRVRSVFLYPIVVVCVLHAFLVPSWVQFVQSVPRPVKRCDGRVHGQMAGTYTPWCTGVNLSVSLATATL